MWKDPIVRKTRKRRDQYAAKFNHDADAIFEDIQRRQQERGAKLFTLPPAPDPAEEYNTDGVTQQ